MRSQLLSSLSAPKAPRLVAKGGGGSGVMPDIEAGSTTGEGTPLDLRCAAGWSAYDKLGLRKKVRELEEEVKNLKFVNEKQVRPLSPR